MPWHESCCKSDEPENRVLGKKDKFAMKEFVIERTNEMRREWWTGTAWSEDENLAKWYDAEPHAPTETGDENARALHYETGIVVD